MTSEEKGGLQTMQGARVTKHLTLKSILLGSPSLLSVLIKTIQSHVPCKMQNQTSIEKSHTRWVVERSMIVFFSLFSVGLTFPGWLSTRKKASQIPSRLHPSSISLLEFASVIIDSNIVCSLQLCLKSCCWCLVTPVVGAWRMEDLAG